jgi:hypothetical protein
MKRTILLTLAFALLVPSAYAWGEKGHFLTNEAATFGMPNDMPLFIYKAYPELIYLSYDPDRLKGAGLSLDAANTPNHFLDYEFVAALTLPPDRYQYLHLMETSGTLARHGIANAESGFLPWRIAELCDQLTALFRLWRTSRPGSPERAFIERDVVHVAGVLGHFAGDAANPLHATMNHNGWLLANPNHYAYDCDVHSRFETWFVNRAMRIEDVVPLLSAPSYRKDYFAAALSFIQESNALVEPLYALDRDGAFRYAAVDPNGKEFAAKRIAAGASLLRDLWWSCWKNSEPKPRPVKVVAPPAE